MAPEPYDPYYRNFPSTLVPVRTPFTRSGRHDAGHVFVYLTSLWKRWSLLLDETCGLGVYDEARQCVPRAISQLWLVEKRYSTQIAREMLATRRARPARASGHSAPPPAVDRGSQSGNVLVVLREPDRSSARQSDIVSYHFEEDNAVAAAEVYTRQQHRRALVGKLLWDELWL
ncbi:MAG: hypothetical protein HYZ50_04785 [Deltaproteobacteria bacterium]|nr:hypothetical protein [Deltaproteobacteria bacterium]